jgi:hypothetical protein
MTIALIGMLTLLYGSLKVFIWACESVRERQQGYERTRVRAGSSTSGQYVDFESGTTRLDFFEESR